ncbi:MAG: UDP-N-acetylglucosamine 1-carboxyvinyltransferase [Oscillospiraceae bacterium]|nr:UDP-N-acetylglucosamine 1-carboxyvinyltransferase [Oscillospiraceae bacterium]
MSTLVINGGRSLSGKITVHGSKNSVLPILAATILNAGVSEIHNCPRLTDVDAAIEILRYVGCSVEFDGDTLTVDSKNAEKCDIPDNLMREMRSSVIFMGALLARLGRVSLFSPGGCELGARPIDLHLSSMRALGADVIEEGSAIRCEAEKLHGKDIVLSFPSVGATENTMIAATAAGGVTRIINAAREPEIEDLQNFLRAIGAEVYGAGSSIITIVGGRKLSDAEYTVIPDRICAATYMCAAALCGGNVTIDGIVPEHISNVISLIEGVGCSVTVGKGSVKVKRFTPLSSIRTIRTMPYPGFPTDAQPQMMALTTKCRGTSVFIENIFDGRYRHVGGLVRMGADIRTEGNIALVNGVPELYGCEADATDLRGGAALVIAAAAAEGESRIGKLFHIDRGYEKIEDTLAALGVDIKRI